MSISQSLEPVNMLPYLAKRIFAKVIKLRILRWGDYLRYPDVLSVITRVLIRERGRQENQRCEGRSRGQSDGIAGSENERRPGAKECGQPVEAGK